MLLDLSRKMHIDAMLCKHWRSGHIESELIRTGRNMDHIHKVFQSMSDLASVLKAVASVKKLASADAKLYRKSRAYSCTDCLQHLTYNPDAVFKASAVFVCTVVEIRREELIEQPAVTGMHHDHLVSCTLCQHCCIAICLHDVSDLLFRKRLHGTSVRACSFARSPLAEAFFLVLVGEICTGILPRMRELDARHCTMSADCVRHKCMRCQASRSHEVQMKHVAGISLRMNDKFADSHRTCSTLCSELIESLSSRTRIAVRSDVSGTHRCREYPVAEIYIT